MNVQSIVSKLPLVEDWIDATLAAHEKLARPVASYSFERLPQFYSPSLLSSTKVVEVERVPMPPLASFGLPEFAAFENGEYWGVTFKDTYFLQASHATNESTHFHELVHVVQWRHLGVERFLTIYAIGLLKFGYAASPLEHMAYTLQSYFDQQGQPADVEPLIRQVLDTNADQLAAI
jgi:hypothetical protein